VSTFIYTIGGQQKPRGGVEERLFKPAQNSSSRGILTDVLVSAMACPL